MANYFDKSDKGQRLYSGKLIKAHPRKKPSKSSFPPCGKKRIEGSLLPKIFTVLKWIQVIKATGRDISLLLDRAGFWAILVNAVPDLKAILGGIFTIIRILRSLL